MSERIEAAAFRPTDAAASARGPWLTRRRALAATGMVLTAAAVWFLWFIFTAKSVRFEADPPPDAVDVEGGFAFRLGDTHLLRTGRYRVFGGRSGFEDFDIAIEVGGERNQLFTIPMVRLPGRVTFEVEPAGAVVAVRGSDAAARAAPFEALLPAGPQVAFVTSERYQDATVQFDVEGMDQAQTVTVALAPDWADVTFPSRPSGAAVLVDGEPIAITTPGPAPIPAGQHVVSLKLAGYKTWTDILDVTAGEKILLPPIVLERADGLIAVSSTPAGASITVDGAYRGTTPLEAEVVPGRSLAIRAFKVGYTSENRTLVVPSGETRAVRFSLAALEGELAIETQPADAELWIDGERRGVATGTVTLPAIPHQVEIRKGGYAGFRKTITPQPGFTQSLRVKLLTLQEARLEALKRVRETSEGHELVLLSPGSVRMGASRREPGRRSNEVLRNVRLTRLFYLGRHEVTNGQFRAFAPGHSSGAFQTQSLDGDGQPVTGVSWQEAALYCNWLSKKDGLDAFYEVEFGKVVGFDTGALGYRLPTEAEWAWTARSVAGAEEPLRYAWGEQLPPPDRHGNYADQSAAHGVARIVLGYNDNHIVAAPVGTFPANDKGIFDIGGNVAEWTNDYYSIPDATDALNPFGPERGDYHVIRGASWQKGTVTDLRLSFRDYGAEGRRDLGFRIARFAE